MIRKRARKKNKYRYWTTAALALLLCMLFMPGIKPYEDIGNNVFRVILNGQDCGLITDESEARTMLLKARREIAAQSEELVFLETNLEVRGEALLYGQIDKKDDVQQAMIRALESAKLPDMQRGYTLKINEYMVNLASVEDARILLQAAIDQYDAAGRFVVHLDQDTDREFQVLKTIVEDTESDKEKRTQQEDGDSVLPHSGIVDVLAGLGGEIRKTEDEMDFEDYELGLTSVNYVEKVEIAESYVSQAEIVDLQTAIDAVIKEQETAAEYEVVSGDTLGGISIKLNIPVDTLVAMNSDKLDDENSTIRVGDTLLVTVPEPELSVEYVQREYVEEIYDEPVIYIDRDDWYTTQTNVIQQPSAGFRRAIVDVHYINNKENAKVVIKQEVLMEAVAKIVERGTKIPPTYIKPISGGRLSSGFGKRTAPTKGASTYHKGVDWAVSTGTTVVASSGGTVSKAGWGSGYGYVVYIDHPDGKQTRYGHLSKVLVKAGQTVKQGEKIALSGNTGVSTGPHIHFEILVGGKQVNPFTYLN